MLLPDLRLLYRLKCRWRDGTTHMISLMFTTGPGSEVQRPLAVVVVGGVFTSTLATLLVLPTLYDWFDRDGKLSDVSAESTGTPI